MFFPRCWLFSPMGWRRNFFSFLNTAQAQNQQIWFNYRFINHLFARGSRLGLFGSTSTRYAVPLRWSINQYCTIPCMLTDHTCLQTMLSILFRSPMQHSSNKEREETCFYMLRNVGNTAAQKKKRLWASSWPLSPVDWHQSSNIAQRLPDDIYLLHWNRKKNKAFLNQDFAACLLCGAQCVRRAAAHSAITLN